MSMKNDFLSSRWASPDRLLLIGIIWFIFPFVILGKFSFVYSGDNLEILVSHLVALGSKSHDPGNWNAASSSGTDVMGMGFVGFVNLALFTYLPGWLAYQILIVIQIGGAITASYFICQRAFGLSKAASLLPGFVYGAMLPGQLIYSVYSLLPVLILSLTMVLDKPQKVLSWIFAAVTVIWISGTAYMSWLVPFPSLMIVGWFLFVDTRRRLLEWVVIGVAAISLQVLRFEDIIALTQIAPLSQMKHHRPLPTAGDIFAWPSLLRNYIDMLCAGLFILAWATTKRRTPQMRGVAAFLLLGLLAEPLALTFQTYFSEYLPFIQGFQVSRISHVFRTVLWLSSAFALGFVLENIWGQGARRFVAWAALLATVGGLTYQDVNQKVLQAHSWITSGNYVHNLESPVIRNVAAEISKSLVPERAEMFQVYSTYLQPYGIETAGGYEPLYMRRYFEFWSTILEPWGETEPDPTLTPTSQEWPFYRNFRLYLTTYSHKPERRLGDLYRLNLLSMVNVGWVFSRDKLTDSELELVSGNVKPWSSLSRGDKILTNLKANFFGRQHLFVYRNTNVSPRFVSPSKIRVFDSGRPVLDAMAKSTIAELGDTIFIAKNDLPAGLSPTKTYTKLLINPVSYGSDQIRLEIDAPGDGLLVGYNTWTPYWTVEIDGKPAQLFPANHAFWGVLVPKGTRKVVFSYQRR